MKVTVVCMSSLLLSIDLRQLCYFIMFYFKLKNGEMVKWWTIKWYNGEINIRIGFFLFSKILNLFICFIFKDIIFAADRAIHNFQYLITNNKYSNQVYAIKPINQQKTGIYQGSADSCKGDRDSDLIFLASEISVNPLL